MNLITSNPGASQLSGGMNENGCWALLDHPWRPRLWTIQEVIVTREGIVVCGDMAVSWATLRPIIQHLEVIGPVLLRKMALNLTMLKHGANYTGKREVSYRYEHSLGWLLTNITCPRKCTDPRDR